MKFISERLRFLFFRQNKLFYLLILVYCFAPLIFIGFLSLSKEPGKLAVAISNIPFLGNILQAHFFSVLILIFILIRQVIKTVKTYEKRKNLSSVSSFIKSLKAENRYERFCFIIRPFGSDECLLIEESLDVSNPFKTNFITANAEARKSSTLGIFAKINSIGAGKILNSFSVPTSIEAIIAESCKVSFDAETICLADPAMQVFPKSVKYLVATEPNWRDAFSILLRKTFVPILIYQPGTIVGHSTRWEAGQINELGLLNRFVIILPPTNSPDYLKAYESLTSLENELPFASTLPKQPDKKPIVICVDEKQVCYFYADNDSKTTSEDYMRSIFQAFKVIKNTLKKVDNKNLYPHWNDYLVEEFQQKHSFN